LEVLGERGKVKGKKSIYPAFYTSMSESCIPFSLALLRLEHCDKNVFILNMAGT
jgi:hypothetical protein